MSAITAVTLAEPLSTLIETWLAERSEVHAQGDKLPTVAMLTRYLWRAVSEANEQTLSAATPTE